MRVWREGVYMKLREDCCVCLMITVKVIVITGGMTLTHSSLWLWGLVLSLPVYQSGVFSQLVLPARPTPLDVTQPHTHTMFSQFDVFSLRGGDAIPLWSKHPRRLPLSHSENDISQNVISPMLHSSSLAQEGIILLVKWSFRQCGPVSVVLHFWQEKHWKVIHTSVSCCQLPWLFLLHICCTNRRNRC